MDDTAIDAVNPCNAFLDRRRVVVGDQQHAPPTLVAGEQLRANRTPGQLGCRPLQQPSAPSNFDSTLRISLWLPVDRW